MPLDVKGARAVSEDAYLAWLRGLDPDGRRFGSDITEERTDKQASLLGDLEVPSFVISQEEVDMREPRAVGAGGILRRVERRLASADPGLL